MDKINGFISNNYITIVIVTIVLVLALIGYKKTNQKKDSSD